MSENNYAPSVQSEEVNDTRVEQDHQVTVNIRRLYDEGKALWTREMFTDIECQLDQDPLPSHVSIINLNGERTQIPIPLIGGDSDPDPESKNFLSVSFEHYQSLVYNSEHQFSGYGSANGGDIYGSGTFSGTGLVTTSYTVFTEWMPVPKSQLYYQTLEHAWVEANESWIRSSACQRLTTILSSAAISKSASQVICFGLGGLELGECERRALDEATPGDRGLHSNNTAIRACMIQHAAALTMATVLGRRFRVDKKPLAILTQDPAYTANDKALLTNKGFQVIEGRGSLAFTHVDDNTLVFSCHPDVPVKQIVADIARPAAMVWNKPDAWEEDSSKWLVNVYEKSRHLVAPANPSSPRTRQLLKDYKEYDFVSGDLEEGSSMHFGNISMWVRQGKSVE